MKGDSNEVFTALGPDSTEEKSSFRYDDKPHPVELLRDERGIYGIGVSDLFDFEAIAWSCGIEPEPYTFEPSPRALILRPDRFLDSRPRRAVLQKIAGGFRRGPFMHTHEEQLRRFIHHEALNRAALPWPPPHDGPSGSRNGGRWTRKNKHVIAASITA